MDLKNALTSQGVYWDCPEIQIVLQNIGHGPALNVSYLFKSNTNIHSTGDRLIAWDKGPIAEKDSVEIYGERKSDPGPRNFSVDGIHDLYPEHTNYGPPSRLTITYHDLFNNIHVSIFDYIALTSKNEYEWKYVNIKDHVKHDVQEFYANEDLLNEADRIYSHGTLPKLP